MNYKLANGIIILVCATGLLLARSPVLAVEPVSANRLLPPEVAFYVTIPNVSDLKERWKKSLYGEMYSDEALVDFWKDVGKQLGQFSDKFKEQIGVTLDDLLQLPSDEVSFAIVNPSSQSMAAITLLNFGENKVTIETLLKKATTALDEKGAKRSTEEFDDTKIIVYTFEKDAENTSVGSDWKLAYFIKDSTIVIASSVPALEAILARWDGKHPKTFADDEVYQYIVQRCRSDESTPLLTWYANPMGLLHGIIDAAGPQAFQAQMVKGLLPALGISQLRAVGGSFDIASGNYESISRAQAYIQFPTTGVLNVFQCPATVQSPPKWVTADTTAYFGMNWDIQGAYLAIKALVDQFKGPGSFTKMLEGLAIEESGQNLHLKKDVIDQLSGKAHFITITPESDELHNERFLFALEVTNIVKMKRVLAVMTKTPGFRGNAREFRGETIYEVQSAIANAGIQTIGIAVTNGHLMLASDVTTIEQIVRGDSDRQSLVDSDDYRKITRHFPSKTSVLAYQKQQLKIKQNYERLRSVENNKLIPGIDFTKLPPFVVVQKYLQSSGSYIIPDRRGVSFVSFSLR